MDTAHDEMTCQWAWADRREFWCGTGTRWRVKSGDRGCLGDTVGAGEAERGGMGPAKRVRDTAAGREFRGLAGVVGDNRCVRL